MTEGQSETELAGKLTSLVEVLPAQVQLIVGAANSTSKKLKSLAHATLAKPITLKEPVGTYTFDNPIFVRQVQIFGPDITALRTALTLTTIGIDGKRVQHKLSEHGKGTSNQFVFFHANRMISAIEVAIDGRRSIAVTRIGFTGYRFDEVEEFSGRLREALDLRRDIERFSKEQTTSCAQAQQKLEQVQSELASAEQTKSELEKAVLELEERKSQGETQLANVRLAQADEQKTLAALEAKVTATGNNEAQLKAEVKSLNEDIGKLKRELKELENDRSVISDEYRDYVREGRSQASLYAWIAGACLAASLTGAVLLVVGAAHYLDPRVTSTSEAYALFVQRLPFTAAFAATIGLLLKLAEYLIKGVYTIHQSRLTLARLLVLAKDTVYSSAADLDITDAERLKERVRLKVDLLKQYLSAELGAAISPSRSLSTPEPTSEQEEPMAITKTGAGA